ncbi:polysaccharide lyase 8 family protein [Kumtagia ephedrae]|uniref:Hyaluronate lyase n=1 Tax=Kumtagia ephedrae TaxID=2116701 RepID=A0A2P7S4M2_9HYPH|nr:polysaccharide lyase 8 family protein [Mesorhizobium ephedrae]PSJ57428.1 hypothetical protein C7I84_17420 [Mesorhizobium ephedrae]
MDHETANSKGEMYPQSMPSLDALRQVFRIMRGGEPVVDISPRLRKLSRQLDNDVSRQIARIHKLVGSNVRDPDPRTGTQLAFTLYKLAVSSVSPSSSFFGDQNLLLSLQAILTWYVDNYFPDKPGRPGNWWFWEIGIPTHIFNILLLLPVSPARDEIVRQAVSAFQQVVPDPRRIKAGAIVSTGANRAWSAGVAFKAAVLAEDLLRIEDARSAFLECLAFSEAGDGFRRDGSFVQHRNHPYTGGYGVGLLQQAGELAHWLKSSPWRLTDEAHDHLRIVIERGYAPLMHDGAMMDMVRGREISRHDFTDFDAGRVVALAVLLASDVFGANDRTYLRCMAAKWIGDAGRSFFRNDNMATRLGLSFGQAQLAEQALLDHGSSTEPDRLRHVQFAEMDRVVHISSEFCLGLAMHSARIARYESINNENLHGWFAADGATYLYPKKGPGRSGFWPTIDPYRIPGVTVSRRPRADGERFAERSSRWVGGSTLNPDGVAGTRIAGSDGPAGLKSWFFFGDEILCIGSDISDESGHPVETTVENRMLTKDWVPRVRTAASGDGCVDEHATEFDPGEWFHIEGIGGYRLHVEGTAGPRARPRLSITQRRGSWKQINRLLPYSGRDLSRRYVTAWFEHGIAPRNAGYGYVILPGRSPSETAAYANAPNVAVVRRDRFAHAVVHQGRGILAANVWNVPSWRGTLPIGPISLEQPASFILRHDGSQLELGVSDPTRMSRTAIALTIHSPHVTAACRDDQIEVEHLPGEITLRFHLQESRGQTLQTRLSCERDAWERTIQTTERRG